MSIILKILTISIVYICIISIFKAHLNEYLFLIRITFISIIFFIIIDEISKYFLGLTNIFSNFNLSFFHIELLFKIVGISIISDFICSFLEDNGENAVSGIVSTTSKILILAMTMPLIESLINICIKIME